MKKHLNKSKKKIIREIEKDDKVAGLQSAEKTDTKETKAPRELREEKKRKPLHLAFLIQAVKTLFIRIPLFIILITAIILGGLKIYMTPEKVQKIAISTFNQQSNGTLKMKVKKFSPFGGFVIKNLIIRNGAEFGKTKFVTIDRLVFKYQFFRLFTGSVRFPKIAVYNPRIYITEQKGVWNTSRLMKPGKKKKKKEKEEEPEEASSGPGPEEISLPISVDFLFKFILQDLRVYVNAPGLKSKMEGLSLNTEIEIPPCRTIPLSVKAVSLIKTLKIELNPKEEMNVAYHSKDAGTEPPLVLTWKLIFNNPGKNNPSFNSIFKFGSYNAPVRFKKTYLAPLNFLISYNMYYDPLKDHLDLSHFKVNFKGRTWIDLGGSVSNVTKNPYISLDMRPGRINLGDLYPYFVSFTGNRRFRFNGGLSLYPLEIRGTGDNLTASGAIKGDGLIIDGPASQTVIPRMIFKYNVKKTGPAMNMATDLQMPRFMYSLKGSKSLENSLSFSAKAGLYNNNTRAELHSMKFRLYNPELKKNALAMDMNGRANLKGGLKGRITIKKLIFDKPVLIAMAPRRTKKKLRGIPFKFPASLTMVTDFTRNKTVTEAKTAITAKVRDFKLKDLRLSLNTAHYPKKKKALLRYLKISSRRFNARLNASGWLDLTAKPFADSKLDISLAADFPEPKTIFNDVSVHGSVKFNAGMKGSVKTGRVKGKLICDNFNVFSKTKKLEIKGLSLNFPFLYPFKAAAKTESLIAVNKSQLIDNDAFRKEPNFTIKLLAFKHLHRNEKIEYMKDFQAHMAFHENIFEISDMKAYILDGSLYSPQILFNMADRKKRNMEYRMLLDLTNIDVARLDTDRIKKRRNAELSLNANFSGTGIDLKKGVNANGYVNIHKVGDKFAKRLMVALTTQKGKSKLGGLPQFVIDNAMTVKSFNFRLNKGLVYTTVYFTEAPLNRVVTVKKNRVSFERIPVQDYIKKVQEGE